jgi:hypothetical protein
VPTGNGWLREALEQRSAPVEVSKTLLPTFRSAGCRGDWPPRRLREPESAGSTPASQTLRGRGAAVLASLMSSRPWVRIPPALLRGRSSDEQSARLSGERPPVRVRSSPLRGGRGVNGSIRGRDPRGAGSNPAGHPSPADAEHRRAPRAVNAAPRAVVVRLHPSAPWGCSSNGRAPRLHRGGAGSTPAVSTFAPP